MSLSGDTINTDDEGYGGHVTTRVKGVSRGKEDTRLNFSPAFDRGQTSYRSQPDDGSRKSFISSPPRPGLRTPSQRHRGTPVPRNTEVHNGNAMPTGTPGESSSFKSWLSSGVLGALNVAAGVTLSTTGQLIAPPLHVTKTVLLPALVALFIDTLDAITPERAKDWFRILSSSAHHLVSVLGSTQSGQQFSNQFLVVLQDILRAGSSPETRQVLVDCMATGVKLADALNTPEVHALVDHMVLLGCRLVDAAASGKTKELLHDTKDLAWNGIEMASDPAATLAFAEVTAHLCYALEDAHHSLEPNPRDSRNKQNQSTYVDPIKMSTFSKQATIESAILSSLGKLEAETLKVAENVPSSVILGEAEGKVTSDQARDCIDRAESVNVQFLREKIYQSSDTQSRFTSQASWLSGGKTTHVTPPGTPPGALDSPRNPQSDKPSLFLVDTEHDAAKPSEIAKVISHQEYNVDDMENLTPEELPPVESMPTSSSAGRENRSLEQSPNVETSALHFYRLLDAFLEKNREKRMRSSFDRQSIDNEVKESEVESDSKRSWMLLQAKVKKLKEGSRKKKVERRQEKQRASFRHLPKHQQLLILVVSFAGILCLLCWIGFALYGMYTFAGFTSAKNKTPTNDQAAVALPTMASSEVVIRIVREVVHVREDGTVIESEPEESSISNAQVDAVTECVSSHF